MWRIGAQCCPTPSVRVGIDHKGRGIVRREVTSTRSAHRCQTCTRHAGLRLSGKELCGTLDRRHRRREKGQFLPGPDDTRSEEHTSEIQSLMRISYAVFCLTKKNTQSTKCQS